MILKNLFEQLKNDYKINTFIETGTFEGHSIQRVLDLGYSHIHSVELNPHRYESALAKFKNRVNLSLGESTPFLQNLCPNISERALFGLDAHGEGGGSPAIDELEAIKTSPRNDHIIVIDDVDVYYNKKMLEDKILELNQNYKFRYVTTVSVDRVLVAYL